MIKLTMPDGAVREAEAGISALDFVKSVSNSLAKKVLAVKINGETKDITTVLNSDAEIQFLTFEDADGRWALRHTGSHILAQAIKRVFKDENVQLAIGPAIDNGFYYDIDMEHRITEDDLKTIEKEMNKIVKENLKLERKEVSRQEALDMFNAAGEGYKVELINDLPEDATNGALPTIAKSKFVEDLSVSLMSGLLIVTVFLSTKNESLFSALTSFVGIEK